MRFRRYPWAAHRRPRSIGCACGAGSSSLRLSDSPRGAQAETFSPTVGLRDDNTIENVKEDTLCYPFSWTVVFHSLIIIWRI
jgi:hypothetical protein